MSRLRAIPPGILLIRKIRGKDWSLKTYRYLILLVTFIAYTAYHASRKPTSIVKSVLDPHPVNQSHDDDGSNSVVPWPLGDIFIKSSVNVSHLGGIYEDGWAPFNGTYGTSKLGEIDVAFLAVYSLGMYVAGHLGDTLDLRLFLTTGMIGSGIFVALFGMGYFWDVHHFWYFLGMQMAAGLFQATGWPSVVAVIGNWFGKRRRGLIMGIWNAHTSVGNISGSLLAASVLDYGWGWSFILPGLFIIAAGIMVFLFLAAYPEDVGFPYPSDSSPNARGRILDETMWEEGTSNDEEDPVPRISSVNRKGVGFVGACFIPGVIPFALCLFFSKLVAYTFLFWLPFYLSQTAMNIPRCKAAAVGYYHYQKPFFNLCVALSAEIGGERMSVKSAGNLSTLFDVGGIVGGILAGYISDKLKARATTAASFMYAAIPSMLLYRSYGNISKTMNIILMIIAGLFVNGPYALITTAVSADLGTHSSLKGDSRALATVTAIIDGTGSIGAALGPLLTGFLSTKGWDAVFAMLMIGACIAGLLLSRLVCAELTERTALNSPRGQNIVEAPLSQSLLRDGRR